MEAAPHCSVGFVGDGDDIAGIQNVEEAFGVTLDDQDAPAWRTAGDVFCFAPGGVAARRIGRCYNLGAVCRGARIGDGNPQQITPDSPLLLPDKGMSGHVKDALFIVALLWLAVLLLVVTF
jgi:hypothetical protein